MSNGEFTPSEKKEFEYKKPENRQKLDEKLSQIDNDVKEYLFGSFSNMMNMVGDDLSNSIVDIVMEDIYDGKYKDAKYESGAIFHIGPVNEGTKKVSDWDDLGVPEYRKPENKQEYQDRLRDIDPKVFQEINKVIGIMRDTLGAMSMEYTKAANRINQDIYDGRYEDATYEEVNDEGGGFKSGIIVFGQK